MNESGVVLMAVYRPDRDLLRTQVESLRAQSLSDWVCHVGIDGPDPEALTLLETVVGGDPRFRITQYAENVGHFRNFERLSQGAPRAASWVAYADQDDYWYPRKLERQVQLLRARTSNMAVVASARIVDRYGASRGLARRKPASCAQLLLKNEVTGCFTVFRRDVLELALPFPSWTRAAVHDHWLAVCAAALGDIVFGTDPLQDYVQHGGNAVGETVEGTLRSHVLSARSDGGLSAHLENISRERWGWRVSMARALLARVDAARGLAVAPIVSVQNGVLTAALARFLAREIVAQHLSLRNGVAMAAAALWWPRVSRDFPRWPNNETPT